MNVEATMHTLDMNQIQTIMRAGGGAGASSSNSRTGNRIFAFAMPGNRAHGRSNNGSKQNEIKTKYINKYLHKRNIQNFYFIY